MAKDSADNKPRLAVIGTGLAGLTSAYLTKSKFDVTVYESQSRAGMGAYVVDYVSNGIQSRIDIPLRIFSPGYYQNLTALYDHIGVEMLTSDHAGAFADENGDMVLHYGNGDLGPVQFSYLKGRSLFSGTAWKIALQSRRFFARAERDMERPQSLAAISFGQYLEQAGAGAEFANTVLLPMLSVTCTCDYRSVKDYPADIMLEYLTCGVHKLGITSAAKGVDDIVPRLLHDAKLLTNATVSRISKAGPGLIVETEGGREETYQHVIIATQAQQAAAMLSGFDDRKEKLSKVPVESSTMSVHTDQDLLPRSKIDLSPVTYHVPDRSDRAEVSVDLTKAIARLSGQKSVFQTWNPMRKIAPNRELARVNFTRPTVTLESRMAVAALRDQNQQPNNRLWFCGSYMTEKIPLLEAAVDSAIAVAEELDVTVPWQSPV
ncbi:MAG: FAD-dependent oxidoreductase [Parasphingorhabdus sp.]